MIRAAPIQHQRQPLTIWCGRGMPHMACLSYSAIVPTIMGPITSLKS